MRGQTNASNIGGTVGDDTHPLKSVNGVLTPVSNQLALASQLPGYYAVGSAANVNFYVFGKVCVVSIVGPSVAQGANIEIANGLPTHVNGNVHSFLAGPNGQARGLAYVTNAGEVRVTTTEAGAIYGEIIYITDQ